jgi:hypothetical protein
MRRAVAVLTSLIVIGTVGWALVWLISRESPRGVSAVQEATPTALGSTSSTHVVMPNAGLTPGVPSGDVTPANIASTICVAGYTSGRRLDDGRTVRPPEAYTNALKLQQLVRYGYSDRSPGDYEEDHLIPLEVGGDGYAAGNLWPEPYAGEGARVKDQLENRLHQLVCSDQLGLRTAQQAIAGNWYAAYERYVVG